MINFDKVELSEEERELEDSFERGEWQSVKNLDAEMKRYQRYARSHSKRDPKKTGRKQSEPVSTSYTTHRS